VLCCTAFLPFDVTSEVMKEVKVTLLIKRLCLHCVLAAKVLVSQAGLFVAWLSQDSYAVYHRTAD